MTWPFENDTGAIVKKLAKRSLASEKRRNLMVVIAVALAAFLVCLSAVISVSIAQIQRNQVADTYEAVFTGVEADHVAVLTEGELTEYGTHEELLEKKGFYAHIYEKQQLEQELTEF